MIFFAIFSENFAAEIKGWKRADKQNQTSLKKKTRKGLGENLDYF